MGIRLTALVGVIASALLSATLVVGLALAVPSRATPASAGVAGASRDSAAALAALVAVPQARLVAADGVAQDFFGQAIAISGDTALVGVQSGDVGANANQGSVYVFVRSGAVWTQEAKLIAADGVAMDNFGEAVAISGDTVVVGAPFHAVGTRDWQGTAYVFVRSGTAWTQQAQLAVADDGGVAAEFGTAVAISGDTAVIGAPGDRAAYVFVRGDTAWTQQSTLTAASGAAAELFGSSVAVSGDAAVVGAPWEDVGGNRNQGSAYAFVRGGATWSGPQTLTGSGATPDQEFGAAVAVADGTAVVGAPGAYVGTHAHQGAAHVFVYDGGVWAEQQRLTCAVGDTYDVFGTSVSIAGDVAVVGAPSVDVGADEQRGASYVFVRSVGEWFQRTRVIAADGAADDHLGASVAISGESVLAGAPWYDVGAIESQGAAYVFVLTEVDKPGRPTPRSPRGMISSRTPTFRWAAAVGAATYEVRIYKGSTLVRRKTGISKTEWKCTVRLPRKVYLTWKVRAHNAAGFGDWSARLRFKVR